MNKYPMKFTIVVIKGKEVISIYQNDHLFVFLSNDILGCYTCHIPEAKIVQDCVKVHRVWIIGEVFFFRSESVFFSDRKFQTWFLVGHGIYTF